MREKVGKRKTKDEILEEELSIITTIIIIIIIYCLTNREGAA